MNQIWTPHLTVAAVIERDGRYLMVEEISDGQQVFNQPAGHVEEHEKLLDAVRREVMEETGRDFEPEAICGIYRWHNPHNQVTYLRISYSGRCSERLPGSELDRDILATHWLDYAQLQAHQAQLRSPLVLRGIDDYLTGQRLPLDLVDEL